MSEATLLVGDVFDRINDIPEGSIDLVVTSPPFLALRSYLPDDHPDKHKEIGSEPTPAAFLDTLLALTAELERVLAPHGSICVELGDTYSGAAGYGSPDSPNPAYSKAAYNERFVGRSRRRYKTKDDGWPLAKSMCLTPHLYTASLAYGRNLLTSEPSPAGSWRIRNVICWARPNPPVGALGDKFRPATSYITVACKSARRYFDLEAVRGEPRPGNARPNSPLSTRISAGSPSGPRMVDRSVATGAPPLDWHADHHPEDGDWLWKLPTVPYSGAHYAVYPPALPERLIKAMAPHKVCRTCGKPSERIIERDEQACAATATRVAADQGGRGGKLGRATVQESSGQHIPAAINNTIGWTDCQHDDWRRGRILDPFAGSGTTLQVATGLGRDAVGIDLDADNIDLVAERVGMFLNIDNGRTTR